MNDVAGTGAAAPLDWPHPSALQALVADALLMRAVADALQIPQGPSCLAIWQIRRVGRYIDEHQSQAIHVVELASAVDLSPSHFARSFRAATGATPHAYLIEHRMRLACALLAHSDRTLALIAVECGLADQAHLGRLFKRYTGSTPSVWRHDPLARRPAMVAPRDGLRIERSHAAANPLATASLRRRSQPVSP
jgi:AraC-like DNA-binding protein